MILDLLNANKFKNRKQLAVLIDPDKSEIEYLEHLLQLANENAVDFLFVGGSLLLEDKFDKCVRFIKSNSSIPVVLFPGSPGQIHEEADAILLLSLISGRNPDLLIGQHVVAAPRLKASELEILPTAYILVDGGKPTTVSYMSGTLPIPADKPGIAASTAMAGEMLGLKVNYLDAGSGALNPVCPKIIAAVKKATDTPLIIGGGIRTTAELRSAYEAGADLVVIGNAFEEHPSLLSELSNVKADFVTS